MSYPIHNNFNPSPQASFAFNQMFANRAEISPLSSAGNSHFGYVHTLHPNAHNPGWHVTTQVGGLRQGIDISVRDYLNNF